MDKVGFVSTRSCIAIPKGDWWEGVYHHSDGYPYGLGCYLFRLAQQVGIKEMMEDILSHDGGWSHYFPGPMVTAGHGGGDNISEVRDNQCYCHGYFAERDGVKPGDRSGVINSQNVDPLSIEWVYIIDPESGVMTILGNERVPEAKPGEPRYHVEAWSCKELDGSITQYPAGDYVLRFRAAVNLNGPEPDWWAIAGHERSSSSYGQTWVDEYLPK